MWPKVWELSSGTEVFAYFLKAVNKDAWPAVSWSSDDATFAVAVPNAAHVFSSADRFASACVGERRGARGMKQQSPNVALVSCAPVQAQPVSQHEAVGWGGWTQGCVACGKAHPPAPPWPALPWPAAFTKVAIKTLAAVALCPTNTYGRILAGFLPEVKVRGLLSGMGGHTLCDFDGSASCVSVPCIWPPWPVPPSPPCRLLLPPVACMMQLWPESPPPL